MMLSGHAPFAPNGTGPAENKKIHARAAKGDLSSLDTWVNVTDEAKDLIRKTVVVDPNARLDVKGVRKHMWFGRYKQELEDLYEHACARWERRTQPVEWIEEVDTGTHGKIVSRHVGEHPEAAITTHLPSLHLSPRKRQRLQMIAEEGEGISSLVEDSRNTIESYISRIRIDSRANLIPDSQPHTKTANMETLNHKQGDNYQFTLIQDEIHNLVSCEQKGWERATSFAKKVEEKRDKIIGDRPDRWDSYGEKRYHDGMSKGLRVGVPTSSTNGTLGKKRFRREVMV